MRDVSRRLLGPLFVGAGVLIALVGLLVWAGWLQWLGHLPGDIRIERDGVRFYFPIVSMLVVSALLSLLICVVRRFL